MASRRRKLPVRPSSSENNSASVSGQLHESEPHESVTLKFPDNTEKCPPANNDSVGVRVKMEPVITLVEEPRRSSRKRKSKSALELLGIVPKKEPSKDAVHAPKKHAPNPQTTANKTSQPQKSAKVKQETAASKKTGSRGRGRPRKKPAETAQQNVSPRKKFGSGDVSGNAKGKKVAAGAPREIGKGDAVSIPIPTSDVVTVEVVSGEATPSDTVRVSDSVKTSGKEATSPETYQLTKLLIELSAASGNDGTEAKGVEEELGVATDGEMLQGSETEITTVGSDQNSFSRETFVLVEAEGLPEGDEEQNDGEEETTTVVEVPCDDSVQETVVELIQDDAGLPDRSVHVTRNTPRSTACIPVTSDDLNNPERSISGRRVKPMKQVVMTQDLQNIVDELQPVDAMVNHINIIKTTGSRKHFTCKYCDKPLLDRHDFRRHIKKHPEVEYKPYVCPLCGYRAQIRAQIARHINIHSDIKPYTCTECGKGFNFKQKLQLHMKYHRDVRDEQCPLCEKAFHEHKTLKTHLLKIHNVYNMRELMKNLASGTKEPIHIVLPVEMTNQLNMVDIPLTATDKTQGDATDAASDSQQASDTTRQIVGICDDAKTIMLSEQDIEQLGLSQVDATSNTAEGATSGVDGAAPKNAKKRNGIKKSVLYGTRKTYINTSRFKMGLLPVRPVAPVKRPAVFDPVTGKRKRFVNNQRVVSEDQMEPELLRYCNVDTLTTMSKVLFHCRLCENEVFPSKTQFAAHLESAHSDIRAWKCHLCNYSCRLRTSLFVHQRVHTGVKDHVCNVCGKGFLFRQKLKMHLKVHLNLREHQCTECTKCFNDKADMKKHFRRVHIAERPFACQLCTKAYKDHVTLKRHLESHSDTKNHLCQHCNKFYRSKLSLSQHMKSHTCMFHCEICDKNFGSYSGFMAHKVMHDESYEGYVCEICSRVLHTKGSLCRHKLVAHSNDRPFACSDCPKNFKTKKDLKNHKYCHVSEKAFACEVCEFQCKRMDSLRVHMRRHAKVKPFQCDTCGRQYTQKHALEVHQRHHTGTTVGQCDICQRTFTTKYQLGVHIRRVHGSDAVFNHDHHEVTLMAPPGEQMQQQPGMEPFTVFMCEECNSVFLTQDSLAVHILAEHMKQGWVEGSTSSTCITEAPDAVIEVTAETSIGDKNAVYIANDNTTIETFVSINDPSSSQEKIVSLIQPLVERTIEYTEEQEAEGELIEATNDGDENKAGTEHYFILNKTSDDQMVKETEDGVVLTISESASTENQEYVVDGVPSALETLLAASQLQQTDASIDECEQHVDIAHTVEIPVTTMVGDGVKEDTEDME